RVRQGQGKGHAVPVLSGARISAFGDGALLVELGDGIDDALASRARALADAWDARGEGRAVPAYASVVVRFDPLQLAPAAAEATVLRLAKTLDDVTGEPRGEIEIPTHYDGPDLLETAERSKLSVEELIALHSGREYRAFFLGFLPGFAYCGVLDPRIVAPTLLRPPERVPAGPDCARPSRIAAASITFARACRRPAPPIRSRSPPRRPLSAMRPVPPRSRSLVDPSRSAATAHASSPLPDAMWRCGAGVSCRGGPRDRKR